MKSINYKYMEDLKKRVYNSLKEFDKIADIFIDDRVFSITYRNAHQIRYQLYKNYYKKRTILDKLVDNLVEVWYIGK